MDWIWISKFIQEVASMITAFGIIFGAAWKLSKNYRKRQEDKRKVEQQETLQAIKEAFKPQTDKLERTKQRVGIVEEITDNHEGRLYVLESKNGISPVKYVERYYGEKEKEKNE